jgi:hypothetical protein
MRSRCKILIWNITWKRKGHFEDLGVDVMLMLKGILKNRYGSMNCIELAEHRM